MQTSLASAESRLASLADSMDESLDAARRLHNELSGEVEICLMSTGSRLSELVDKHDVSSKLA